MERGRVLFTLLFLVVPLLALLAVVLLPGAGLGLLITAIALLMLGFVLGIGFLDL